jgi:hypothetical protein
MFNKIERTLGQVGLQEAAAHLPQAGPALVHQALVAREADDVQRVHHVDVVVPLELGHVRRHAAPHLHVVLALQEQLQAGGEVLRLDAALVLVGDAVEVEDVGLVGCGHRDLHHRDLARAGP